MHRRILIEPQDPERVRALQHRGAGGDRLLLGRANVPGDLFQQIRHVVQQLVCREHIPRLDVQQLEEALQPRSGKRGALRRETRREVIHRRDRICRRHVLWETVDEYTRGAIPGVNRGAVRSAASVE